MTLIAILQLILTGAVAGLAAGFMGIGGGAVLTPLCLLVYPALGLNDDNMVKVIFGTNMMMVTVFSMSAVFQHFRNKKIDWSTVWTMGPVAVAGSLLGAWAAAESNPAALKKAFAVLLLISSVLIVLRGSTKPGASASPRSQILSHKLLPLLALITGFAGSFLGIGGGVVMIPALILLFAVPIERVAGTSSSVIIFIGLTGVFSYMFHGQGVVNPPGWSTGYVWWSAAIPLAIGGVPMARLGAYINARTHVKVLQRVFGLILFVIAVKMLFF